MASTIDREVIFAVRARKLDLLKERVLDGGNINCQDSQHGSPLVAAINNNDVDMLKYLVENGANVNAENFGGVVPLEIALHHSTDEIVRLLSWSGAKLKSRCRPHWKERLQACLNDY